VYRANFEAEIESYRAATSSLGAASSTRAASDSAPNGQLLIQADALTSRKAGFGKEIQTALRNLADGLPRLSRARASAPELTDAVLTEQMNLVGAQARIRTVGGCDGGRRIPQFGIRVTNYMVYESPISGATLLRNPV